MVEIIAGQKGKGKTKYLLEKANSAIKDAKGSIVYLDKSSKHMYELNNRVRLINVTDFGIKSYEAFIGFVCGIISQDHDLEQMYLDSFLKMACLEGQDITEAIDQLTQIGKTYDVTFILSVSQDAAHLPENAKDKIVVSL
ncbi:MAG: twitching motility protein PilT [Lachnospiraceae bacterium]|nr:twitching motility protein PilT [Lachnospiraceae bacterium]